MHGETATIADIILKELDEQRVPDLEEDPDCLPKIQDYEEYCPLETYRVLSRCGICETRIRLVVSCDPSTITDLHHLLLGTLSFLCPNCAGSNGRR
ncbi:MAG: early protein 7 [Equus asinus papillomavirus 3]|nr:MAG: early protein 7 [Equus asinus papillomavirus 3]